MGVNNLVITNNTQWNASDDSFGDESISIFMANELGGFYNLVADGIPNYETYEIELPESEDIFFTRFKVTAIDSFGNQTEDFADNYFATALTPKFEIYSNPEVAYFDASNQLADVEFTLGLLMILILLLYMNGILMVMNI